jgi:ribosomal protein S27AE
MTDPMPTIKYTGLETCPKCGGNDIAANHDEERNLMNLSCRKCAAKWDVLPLDDPAT